MMASPEAFVFSGLITRIREFLLFHLASLLVWVGNKGRTEIATQGPESSCLKTEVQSELTQPSPGSPSGEDSDDITSGAGLSSSRGTLKEQGVLLKTGDHSLYLKKPIETSRSIERSRKEI